ncbi:MAG: DUF3750 domain-containing protein [Alphaproteobacteria bacterium]
MQRKKGRRWTRWLAGALMLAVVLPVLGGAARVFGHSYDWRTAPRHSIGIAPDPATTPEAVVQVYVARAFGWRGALGSHSWIAVKRTGAPAFTVHEVVGWYAMRGESALRQSSRAPDGLWYGNRPEIIAELRGDGVDDVIARIEAAARAYPYARRYKVWPGPNSNTFTAFIGRAVPELRLDLPPTAIGKDYLPNGAVIARAPSGTGWQVSLFGLLGVMLAVEEGIEINLLGLTLGIDFGDPALKLPGIGRLGFSGRGAA